MAVRLFGITGKKASGKSTVSKTFRKNNVPVIDVDGLCIDMFKPGTRVHKKIINIFGEEYLNNNGSINIKKLSVELCEKKWIKNTIDCLMEDEVACFIEKLINTFSIYNIDIAGIESGIIMQTIIKDYVAPVILIDSTDENRRIRMKKTMPTITIDNVIQMENYSISKKYDFIIKNNGSLEELEQSATNILKDLLLYFQRNNNE